MHISRVNPRTVPSEQHHVGHRASLHPDTQAAMERNVEYYRRRLECGQQLFADEPLPDELDGRRFRKGQR